MYYVTGTPPERESVLLTGATGFIGAHLCARLLRTTPHRVFCLVRVKRDAHPTARLFPRLRELGTSSAELTRVVPLRGNLAIPGLGLPSEILDTFADEVTHIFHCGAWVSMAISQDALHSTNLASTNQLIGLAERGRPKTVHYFSSIGVYGSARRIGLNKVDEHTPISAETSADMGYTQTKRAAEEMLRGAATRGVRFVIHRPGQVLGDSGTGTYHNPTDVFNRLIATCVELGIAPRTIGQIPVCAVDYVTNAIVAVSMGLSTRPTLLGRAFHLVEPEPLYMSDVFDHARSFGYHLSDVNFPEWEVRLRKDTESRSTLVLLAAWDAVCYLLAPTPRYLFPHTRSELTRSVLAELEVPCPTSDQDFFHRAFSSMVSTGELPPPRRQPCLTH